MIIDVSETSTNQNIEQLGTEVALPREELVKDETVMNEIKIEDITSAIDNTIIEETQIIEPEIKDEIVAVEIPKIIEELIQVDPEVQGVKSIKSIPSDSLNSDSPQATYKKLISAANEIETQEVRRVEEIIYLKNQASINRKKSEEILAQVDKLVKEEEIITKLAEANKYRLQAEKQEIEAENQEIILKNNVSESRAQREEAKMILAIISEEDQAVVIAEVESNNEDLKKVTEFL